MKEWGILRPHVKQYIIIYYAKYLIVLTDQWNA